MVNRIPGLVISSALVLGGCAGLTAEQIREDSVAFNSAVAEAMDRQMLLNIVRIARNEPTQWVTVSAINAQTQYRAGADMTGSGFPAPDLRGAASIGFTYTPTLTFLPRQGEELSQELMEPIPVGNVVDLIASGWPASWLMLLAVDRCQDLLSFDVTTNFGIVADDVRFGRLLELLDAAQGEQFISITHVQIPITWNARPLPADSVTLDAVVSARSRGDRLTQRDDGTWDYVSLALVPVLTAYPGIEGWKDGKELLELLSIDPKPGTYRIASIDHPVPNTVLTLHTRSLMAVLRLLSQGVDRTPNEAAPSDFGPRSPGAIFTRLAKSPSGRQDIGEEVRYAFRVHCGPNAPAGARAAVPFEGLMYWIEGDDVTSNRVFTLVRDLFDLQIRSERDQSRPVLTLPLN
jgi:hypothetical protein